MYVKAFTTVQTFNRGTFRDDYATITVLNAGSVAVELRHSSNPDVWVLAETFTAGGAYVVRQGTFDMRITPAGGAEFNVSNM